MKILFLIIGLILLFFIGIQLFGLYSQRNIETYPYKVQKKYPKFEIRDYESSLFTSVKLPGNQYKEVSSKGFSILAGYIFGGNQRNEKIAMTSPVAMSLEDSMTMMFMVPSKYNQSTLPQPDQSAITFKEEPDKRVAAIRFGGWADDQRIKQYRQKLTNALQEAGIPHSNRFYFLGYNAPYEVLGRKNEVMVELGND